MSILSVSLMRHIWQYSKLRQFQRVQYVMQAGGFEIHNFHARYVLVLALSRLLLLSEVPFPDACKKRTLVRLKGFCETASCSSVTALEDKYSYNWITMVPFVDTMYAPRCCSGTGAAEGTLECYSSQVAVFALHVELSRERNRTLIGAQGLGDFVACVPWVCSPEWRDRLKRAVDLLRGSRPYQVPRLLSIVRAKLAKTGVGLSLLET